MADSLAREGGGDFRRAESAKGAQRECGLGFDGELRMKADEHHAQVSSAKVSCISFTG